MGALWPNHLPLGSTLEGFWGLLALAPWWQGFQGQSQIWAIAGWDKSLHRLPSVLLLRIKLCDSQLSKFSFRCFVVFFWWWFVEFVLLEQKHVSHREEHQSHALRDCGSQQPLLNSDSSCCQETGPSDSARESSPDWTPSRLGVYTGSLSSLTSLSCNYIRLQEKHLPQTSEPGELCSYNGDYGLSLSLGISHFSVTRLLQFQ